MAKQGNRATDAIKFEANKINNVPKRLNLLIYGGGSLSPLLNTGANAANLRAKAIQGGLSALSAGKGITADKSRDIKNGLESVKLASDAIKSSPETTSYLGTPVFDTVTFGSIDSPEANNYIDITGDVIPYNPIRLVEILVEVNRSKTIVKTKIRGRQNSIKEYIVNNDYQITLRGRLSGEYDASTNNWKHFSDFPENAIARMEELCNIPASIPFTSTFGNLFGIENVVIESYSFPQREGFRNQQEFTIVMSSDENNIIEFSQEDLEDLPTLKQILGV